MVHNNLSDSSYVTHLDVTRPFIRAAIDAACRESDAMKRKRTELTTDEVIARLDRFIGQAKL